jgi:hypothetical protein
MRRLSMVTAAAVASALLVVAVAALDAVGADNTSAKPPDNIVVRVAQCLRDRGVAVPAVSGDTLMRWLDTHRPPDAIARACKEAVAPPGVKRTVHRPGDDAKTLVACLRAHGLDAPSDPYELKRWILAHEDEAVIKECGMGPPPSCGDKDGQRAAPAEGDKEVPAQ